MRYNHISTERRTGLRRLHIDTDRGAMLATLALPGILMVIAFLIAIALTAFGVPTLGTLRSTVAAVAYLYLTLCVMWLPAYCIAFAWYWWASRDDAVLLQRLWFLPLVEALFVWFPSILFADIAHGQRIQVLMPFVLTAIVSGYVWVGLVRLLFYVWRRK